MRLDTRFDTIGECLRGIQWTFDGEFSESLAGNLVNSVKVLAGNWVFVEIFSDSLVGKSVHSVVWYGIQWRFGREVSDFSENLQCLAGNWVKVWRGIGELSESLAGDSLKVWRGFSKNLAGIQWLKVCWKVQWRFVGKFSELNQSLAGGLVNIRWENSDFSECLAGSWVSQSLTGNFTVSK